MLPYSADFEAEVLDKAGGPEKDKRDAAAAEMGAPSMVAKISNTGYKAL